MQHDATQVMQYDLDHISAIVKDVSWRFSHDLRPLFPAASSNQEIVSTLSGRGVFAIPGFVNAEASVDVTNAVFRTEEAAEIFVSRLNAQPEVRSYLQVLPALMTQADWEKLSAFLKTTLTAEQHEALSSLGLRLHFMP